MDFKAEGGWSRKQTLELIEELKPRMLLYKVTHPKKIRAATRSGMSADEVYISKLWCFNELHFLLNANDEIRGQSNLELNTVSKICVCFYFIIRTKTKCLYIRVIIFGRLIS